MRRENPEFEKKEVVEPSFEKEMASLAMSLQNLVDGKVVDYEKQMKDVENQLEAMEAKYGKDQRITEFFKKVGRRAGAIAIGMGGVLALLLPEKEVAVGVTMGGLSLSALALYAESKVSERAIKVSKDIQELIIISREFTSAYLQKEGAEFDKSGRLEVAKEQVERAREEMNKEL